MSTASQLLSSKLPTRFWDFKLELIPAAAGEPNIVLSRGIKKTLTWPLVRIQSECITGEVFGSIRCDCGPQLHLSLELLGAEKVSLLFYGRQEGRSIGLKKKIEAYKLQDEQGLDTVEANQALGLPADGRQYSFVVDYLLARNIRSIRLLTNNPAKLEAMRSAGIEVDRVPLHAGWHPQNERYRRTKQAFFGHYADQTPGPASGGPQS